MRKVVLSMAIFAMIRLTSCNSQQKDKASEKLNK